MDRSDRLGLSPAKLGEPFEDTQRSSKFPRSAIPASRRFEGDKMGDVNPRSIGGIGAVGERDSVFTHFDNTADDDGEAALWRLPR